MLARSKDTPVIFGCILSWGFWMVILYTCHFRDYQPTDVHVFKCLFIFQTV